VSFMSSIQAKNVNHPGYREILNETKYTHIRDAILGVLPGRSDRSGMTFADLEVAVRDHLVGHKVPMELFPQPGSIRWYTKVVQLDLEAREMIERVPEQTPLRLRKTE